MEFFAEEETAFAFTEGFETAADIVVFEKFFEFVSAMSSLQFTDGICLNCQRIPVFHCTTVARKCKRNRTNCFCSIIGQIVPQLMQGAALRQHIIYQQVFAVFLNRPFKTLAVKQAVNRLLARMRTLADINDSIIKTHVQGFCCMLSQNTRDDILALFLFQHRKNNDLFRWDAALLKISHHPFQVCRIDSLCHQATCSLNIAMSLGCLIVSRILGRICSLVRALHCGNGGVRVHHWKTIGPGLNAGCRIMLLTPIRALVEHSGLA